MSPLLTLPFYLAHMAVLPFIFAGLVRKGKARLQNREGPPLLQPLFDFLKLLRKGETVSETATWIFRAAPTWQFAAVATVGLMVGWLGLPSPIEGDLVLAVYLLALAKFAVGLAALDTGSAFGGLGASRESTVSIQAEPALMLAFAALAGRAHSSRFSAMLTTPSHDMLGSILVPLLVVAIGLAVLAELARMPVDDPTTHLELTMIHETLILENSGRNLALVEYGVSLKAVVLIGLLAQVVLIGAPDVGLFARYLITLILLAVAAVAIIVAESTLVKLRWRRIPNFLSFALAAATLACVMVALKG